MKIFKAFFIITFSFTLLLLTIAADNKDAGDIWLTAYSLYEKAEQYYNSEDYSSSFVYYQKALKKFNDLNCAYPDWNFELVSYRITHCEEKEAIIKNKLTRGNMDKSSDELVKENIELQTRLADYQDKLTNEQTKLKDALSRTENNQGEFLKKNEAAEKLKQVMKENIELGKKYSLVNEGLGSETIENSNLIETLRKDMEHQRKKLESVLEEKKKTENERNEFKKKYSDMVVQKAGIDYRLKVENEKLRNRESNYSQASKRIDSLSDEIKRLTVEKNNLAGKLSSARINLHEEHQSGCSLKTIIENNSNDAVVQLSKENSSLKKRAQDFQKEIDRLNGIKDSYSYELSKMKEIQGEATKTISSLQSGYSTVGEEIENLRKVLNKNEARESEYSKKITEMAAKLAESKEEYTLLTDKYRNLESKQGNLTAIQNRNLDLEQEKKQLSEQIQNYQLQAEEAKRQMASIHEAKENLEKEQVKLIQGDFSCSLESESKYTRKVTDLNETSRKLKELEASNTEKEQKLNELLTKINSSEENYANLHRDNNKIQQELLNAEAMIDGLRKTNSAQLKDASNLSDQLRLSNIKNQEYGRIKDQLERSIQDSNSKLSSLKKEHDEHLCKYNDLMKKYGNQEIEHLKKQLSSLDEKSRNFPIEKSELNKKITDYEQEIASNEAELKNSREETKKLTDSLADYKKKLDSLSRENQGLKSATLDAGNRISSLEKDKKGFFEKIKALTDKLEEADNRRQHSNCLISLSEEKNISLNSKINEMEKVRDEQSSLIDSLQKQLEAVNKKNGGSNSKGEGITPKLIEASRNLAASEEKLSIQNSAAAKYQDDYKNLQKTLNEFQDNRKVLENKYAEAVAKVKSQETLNKEQEKRISDLLGRIDSFSISLGESKRERDILTQQLVEHSTQFSKTKKDYESQIARLNSIIEEGRKNGGKAFQLTADNFELINNLKRAEEKIKDLEQRHEEQLKKVKTLSLRLDQKIINNCEKEVVNKNINLKLASATSRLNDLEKERVTTSARVNELLNGISERDRLLQSQKDANSRMNSALNSSCEFEKKLFDSQSKVNELTTELKNVKNRSNEKNIELNNLLDKARARAARYKDFSVAGQARVKELEKQLFECKNKVEAANKNIDEMEVEISSNNLRINNLSTELNTLKKVSAKNGAGIKDFNDKLSESSKKISEYKAREELYLSKNKILSEKLEKVNKIEEECRKKQLLFESQNAAINYVLKVMENEGENSESRTTELVKSFSKTNFLTTIESDLKQKLKGQLLENQKNLVKINDKYEKLNEYNKGLISKLDKIQSINAEVVSNNQKMVKDLDSAKSELSDVIKDRTFLQGKMKNLLTQLNKITTQNSEIKLQKEKLEESLLSKNKSLRGKELDIVSSSRQIEGVTHKMNKLNDSLSKSERNVGSIQIEYEKLLNKNMNIEKSFQNLNKQFTSVKNDLKESGIRAKNLESINRDFQERLLNEKNKTAALQKNVSEKTEIIKGLTKEIDEFKRQIADSTTSQVLLRNNLENSLSIVESLKKDKSELLHRMESIVSESDKLAKGGEMTDGISATKRQFYETNITPTSTTVVDYPAAKIKDLTQKNIELSKKLAKVTRRQKFEKFSGKNPNIALSLEDKKRVFKLISSASQGIKNNDNILAYRYLSKAADIVTNNYTLQKNAGILAMNCGDYANAIRYFTEAKYIKAENSEVSVSLGVCFLNINEPHKAFAEFAEAADVEENKTELGKLLEAFCIGLASEYRKAKSSGKTLEQYLHFPEVAYKLAELLIACSPPKLHEAQKWYKIAVGNGAHSDSVMEQKFRNL